MIKLSAALPKGLYFLNDGSGRPAQQRTGRPERLLRALVQLSQMIVRLLKEGGVGNKAIFLVMGIGEAFELVHFTIRQGEGRKTIDGMAQFGHGSAVCYGYLFVTNIIYSHKKEKAKRKYPSNP